MEKDRPTKDRYYIGIAKEVAARGVCHRRFSGAIIVKDDQIVSTGYTGCPRKTADCYKRGTCLRQELGVPSGQRYELCRSVHAEQNAIINAARSGACVLGGDIYIFGQHAETGKPLNAFPCFICKKMLINAGLCRVVCCDENGKINVFSVEKWQKEWQDIKTEIIDDKNQYGVPIERGKI